jgi:hypothetical protein
MKNTKTKVNSLKTKRPKASKQRKKAVKRSIKASRPIHKRLLLNPLSMLLILCVGVLVIGWTYKSLADSYVVTAQVDAPALEQGAVITYPSNGQTFTDQSLVVQGTCQVNSYVDLYDNSVFDGVAWCANDGSFSIQVSLFEGQNVFEAEAYNITNQQGPTTPTVTVSYAPLQTSSPPSATRSSSSSSKSSTTPSTSSLPLLLVSSFSFQTFFVNTPFNWPVSLQGGTSPFSVDISWGDGKSTTLTFRSDGKFTISHTYIKAGYYAVIVRATDNSNDHASLQLAALIETPGQAGFSVGSTNSLPPISRNQSPIQRILQTHNNWLLLAWPVYIVLVLMAISFWLGEKQEYFELVRFIDRKPRRNYKRKPARTRR